MIGGRVEGQHEPYGVGPADCPSFRVYFVPHSPPAVQVARDRQASPDVAEHMIWVMWSSQ
jgi:hypothetical protein